MPCNLTPGFPTGHLGKRSSDVRSTAGQQKLPLQGLFDGVAAVTLIDCNLDLQAFVAWEEQLDLPLCVQFLSLEGDYIFDFQA
jgi:hypothetical protein